MDPKETNEDFVTVLPTNNPVRYLVAVMTYHKRDDEYIIKKVSEQALPHVQAEGLARSWAAALSVEVR